MKTMIDKFDEAKGKIKALEEMVKQKDADNSVLVTCIVGEYESATLKARYELLKEYKQGLLVDAEVDEEIELFEEPLAEAGDSPSVTNTSIKPVAIAAPTASKPRPVTGEPPTSVDPPDGLKA
ncbi:hypothetical protein TIFTF001_020158 [Ficus carica]|uniref:Uncharacterized protein n=1 Tax=Ficus carica TaxID=3494 RepID=A0AA88AFK8_FICCA|nr:hypothetical protein TIFTF001_020158 [Ficus carica]